MRVEISKRYSVSILLISAMVIALVFVAKPASAGGITSTPGGTTISVASGDTFLLRHELYFDKPAYGGYFTIAITWNCPTSDENFTVENVWVHWTTGPKSGENVENVLSYDQPTTLGGENAWQVVVKIPAGNKVWVDENFNVDIWLRAASGGASHKPGLFENVLDYGLGIMVTEKDLILESVDPVTIHVFRRGVNVSISPGSQSGTPCTTLNYTVTVTNTGTENDNFDLGVSDTENWAPTLDNYQFENVPENESRTTTLRVHIPENATGCTRDNVTVTATSQADNTVIYNDSCIAHVKIVGVWWDNDWSYRKEITIDHTKVDADLTDFPVLIDITDNDLKSHAQADGDDIAFADNSGTKLNHEIELYYNSTGHLVAWVSIDLSSIEDTILYMYYGNAGASSQENVEGVWDDNYVMVQHLEETSGAHYDSTSYSNDGSPNCDMNKDAAGKINGADEFDGSDDYIYVSDDPSLDHASGEGFTYTTWIKSENLSYIFKAIVTHRDPGLDNAVVGLWTSEADLYTEVKNDDRTSVVTDNAGVTLSLDTWYYVGLTRSSGGSVNLWLNGSSYNIGTCTGDITPSQDLHIGQHVYLGDGTEQYFDGFIDEVRVSNIERGSGWILTSYNNQSNPSAFYSVGSEEIGVVPEEPFISDESPVNGSINVELNPTLQADIIDYQENAVDWWIKENSTGTWQTVDNGTLPTGGGTISASPTTMTSYETTYWWSASATDGTHWASENYCFTTKATPGPWWDTGWQYRRMITIDHAKVSDNLTNFPVLISLTSDSDLASHARFDGADITFADYDGNRLTHEIEFYNGNTGELVAWVNVPELSSTQDTKIYLYYGNSGAENLENSSGVWDSNYVMVQHLPHNWIPYSGNPVFSSGTFASVLKVGDTYHMYYYDYFFNTGHATSPDGLDWTADTENNPVLEPTENWEGNRADVPWVWKENDNWYMLYRGGNPPVGSDATGLATSSDGINWVKYENNPVLVGESGKWDAGGAEIWGTIKVDSTYYTYYECWYSGIRCLGVATSTDLVNWTKDPNNPIMGGTGGIYDQGVYEACVFEYGGYYYMLVPHYTYGTDYANIELYRDTSPTFYPENREYLGPVKPLSHTGWDSHDQDTPCVLTDDIYNNSFNLTNGELWMYHDGEAGPRRVGLVVAPSIPQAVKGAMRDSTNNNNHGDSGGIGGPVPQFSIIGGGYNFDGLDEYMFVPDSSSLDIDNEMTLDVWVKLDTELSAQPNSYPGIISKRDNSSETGYGIWFNTTDNELIAYIGSGTAHTVSVDVGGYDWTDWHHITVTYDGTMNIYVDNDLENSELIGEVIGVNNENLWIGDLVDNAGNVIDGSIGEVRISNISRSAEWISTTFYNESSPSTFYSVGSEEIQVRGVDVSILPPENSGVPGETLTYAVTVNNTGNVADNYSLENSDNAGWVLMLDNDLLTIPAGENRTTTLRVAIPGDAVHCTRDNVTVTATSEENENVSDNASCIAHVAIVRGVEVSISPSENGAEPCNWLEYTVTIRNTGNVADNFDLTWVDTEGWDNIWLEDNALWVDRCDNENSTMLHVHIPWCAEGCTWDNITITATSRDNMNIKGNDTCRAHVDIVRGVEVSIEPESQLGVIGENVVFTVTVKNTGNVWDNYNLTPTDDAGWTLKLDYDYLEIPKSENRETKLTVLVPDNENLVCTTDNITVVATAVDNAEVTDNETVTVHAVHVVEPWTGTAVFSLENLYTVNVEKILDLNQGSKLVVKFYTYGDSYESENVIETFVSPAHVEENENARHPGGTGVKKARLDLTTDDTGNVISTIATWTTTKSVLITRISQIKSRWPFAGPSEKSALIAEISVIKGQWPFAP